jgi:MFS family permease
MLTDISTEMVSGLLPVFLMTVLGASASAVGLIEGLAAATTMVVKVFSGSLSDYWGRRKPLVLLGYGLSALSKPLLAIAPNVSTITAARVSDRIGKGVRDAPRDALIADVTPPAIRGAAFGLRQALDTVGAFVGPLLAMGLMLLWANDYRRVFWVATIPALTAVVLIYCFVHEPAPASPRKKPNPISKAQLSQLNASYWWLVLVGMVLALARFSDAFLVLRAQQDGLALAWTPVVLIVMNVVYAALAYPFGLLGDKVPSRGLLACALVALIGANALLALGGWWLWAGIALWGVHMSMTQGLLSALVAQASPQDLRGTAFGIFYLATGLGLLIASTLAGVVWDHWGAQATFVTGTILGGLALVVVWGESRRR